MILRSCSRHALFALTLLCAVPTTASADLNITEFLAKNADVITDEDGDYSDYIELFNSGPSAVDLDGYYLTDDSGALTKFRLPAVTLDADDFLLVFASGKNRAVPGSELHSNFSLASAGDYLALVEPDGATVVQDFGPSLPEQFENTPYGLMQTGDTTSSVFLNTGAACSWLVPTSDIGASWRNQGFDDSSWDNATTGIGYENGSGYQALFGVNGDVGNEMSGITSTVYIRIPFQVPDPSSVSELTLKMKYDDGFIAYLNGVRVGDGNGPASPTWQSTATSDNPDGNATSFEDVDITAFANLLQDGANMLAIHGLNGDNESSDVLQLPEIHAVRLTNPTIGGPGYLATPSPGFSNGDTFGGFVSDTNFSVNRGFYKAAFDVEISTITPGASIRYTLDGSEPSEVIGTLYSGPITISRTSPLRAIAYMTGAISSNVDTQTYIFVDDVVRQDANYSIDVAGLPSSWDGQSPDYGMDSDVVNNGAHSQTIRNDLKTVPTLSIAMEADDMFGGSGIYSNPGNSGSSWERPTSLELIDPANPDGINDFQVNCGIRIQGGAFRSFGLTLKKSFRVLFKGDYGPTKLRYEMFGPDVVDSFDTLTFRMESNDGYQWGNRTNVQYARDEFGRRSQLAMGWPSGHGRYLHIYINGVYWGLYNVIERPDASFGAAYFGADKDNWDGINSGSAINEGSTAPWNTMIGLVDDITSAGNETARTAAFMRAQGKKPDGSNDTNQEDYIDVDNFIDYLLVNWYMGNSDWPFKNYYCGRERGPGSEGFKFFMWDAEWALFLNSNSDRTGDFRGVAAPQEHLRKSLEYRVRFGDRTHRALFNNGAMTNQVCVDRWNELTADHTSILVPELARWGDQHGTLRTIQNWTNESNNIKNNWLATRESAFLNHLKNANLYPDVDAPIFSRHGGSVSQNTPVTMSTDASSIYFTADGTDPRLSGGGINPAAQVAAFGGGDPTDMTFMGSGHSWKYLDDGSNQGTAWRASEFDDNSWAVGPSELGYGEAGIATELSFGGNSANKQATTYFRTTVDIPSPGTYDHILIRLRYDDGASVYVNGAEIVRTTNLAANAAFDAYTSNNVSDEGNFKEFEIPTGDFLPGVNTIAVEVHQGSGGSSDMRMDMILRGVVSVGGGANVSDPIFFSGLTLLKARSYSSGSGEWSALNEAWFTIDTEPADSSNLVVSEFHYHPADPVTPAELTISGDRDDYEFVEMMNIGTGTLDLSGVLFRDGITFEFPQFTMLGVGERLLVVRNQAAFEARYGTGQPVAGVYGGRLSNDGEQVIITSTETGEIQSFVYNDQLPWPVAADGLGSSLVLVDPLSNPDHADTANWQASLQFGGSPGNEESGQTYAQWSVDSGVGAPGENPDGDSLDNFSEFGFGGLPLDATSSPLPTVDIQMIGEQEYGTITFRQNLSAAGVTFTAEMSGDLATWTPLSGAELVEIADNGDGTADVTYRTPMPVTSPGMIRSYLRVRLIAP